MTTALSQPKTELPPLIPRDILSQIRGHWQKLDRELEWE